MRWYVEYTVYGKFAYMGGIEAEDGNAAIEYVRAHVIGINRILGVWQDAEN